MLKIGIIGLGVVGGASKFGFEKLSHEVFCHDIKLSTKIEDVLETDVVFISVPTPCKFDGSCDTSIVKEVIGQLCSLNYDGIIAIRSTITPGTTQKLIDFHGNDKICFIPEFLRERCAVSDFVENNKLLAIGSCNKEVQNTVCMAFGHYPKNHTMMTPTEAELLKYYHNSFSALRVVFANEFYEICKNLNANYTKVKNGLLHSSSLPDIYLDVNENIRGYSSICWNKDIPALCALAKQMDLDLPMMFHIEVANNKFKKTPFKNTREHY